MQKIDNQSFAKKFDSIAETYDQITNSYVVERRVVEALKTIHGSCLEVGGGSGNLAKKIQDKSNYVFSDISPKMCKFTKQKYNCKVICCDAENLPFPQNKFNTIVSLEMIYFLRDPDKFIKETFRTLKSNGILILSTFNNKLRFYDKIRRILRILKVNNTYFDDGIKKFMPLKQVKKILNKNNFKILEIKKIAPLPLRKFHKLNLFFEKTFFRHLGTFIIIVAQKVDVK